MKRYIRIYFKHHGLTKGDTVLCEVCDNLAVDIHHIEPRGMGGNLDRDVIGNLIALCRWCHDKAEAGTITKEELLLRI